METNFNQFLNENKITPSKKKNTMSFWHGGNLDEFNDNISQKNGRYEYGSGLYLTTEYKVAERYSKGRRKLYMVTVEKGVDINDVLLDKILVKNFINHIVIGRKVKDVWERVSKHLKDNKVKAYILDNVLLNEKAIPSTKTKLLIKFYVENGIDYNIVKNAFGWGETMLVLYNMDKIIDKQVVKPNDEIDQYSLPTNFN